MPFMYGELSDIEPRQYAGKAWMMALILIDGIKYIFCNPVVKGNRILIAGLNTEYRRFILS